MPNNISASSKSDLGATIKQAQTIANSPAPVSAAADTPPTPKPITSGGSPPEPSKPNTSSTPAVTPTSIQNQVNKTISESEDLISALESVGAMYGIPSTNMLVDNSLQSIKVVEDKIIVPDTKNVSGNIKSIVCAIGAVLDYISQRVDNKLTEYQTDNMKHNEEYPSTVDPNKGVVISRHVDDDGNEVIIYDTGRIDFTGKAGVRKAEELKNANMIPEFNPNKYKQQTTNQITMQPTYFNDDDDISKDVPMDNDVADNELELNDVGETINESHQILELISKYNNTRHLGYDIMQEHGFTYVKPTDSPMFIQESKTKSDNIDISDIKYLKFDNKNLVDAIKFFNEARSHQTSTEKGKINLQDLINDSSFQKGIDSLNKQFNARINLRIWSANSAEGQYFGDNMMTSVYNELKTKLTVSKSKGFQLGGLPIEIFIFSNILEADRPDDVELFGQHVISIILHEIFHNIYGVMRETSATFDAALTITMSKAATIRDAKKKRIFLTNYVNTIDRFGDMKLNRIKRRVVVKQLMMLSTIQFNDNEIKKLKESANNANEEDIDKIIEAYDKAVKRLKNSTKYGKDIVASIVGAGLILTSLFLQPAVGAIKTISLGVGAIILGGASISASTRGIVNAMRKSYSNTKQMEEYYCDLFAAMYKLPVAWLIGPIHGKDVTKYTPNQIATEKLNKLAMLEKEIFELAMTPYPSNSERSYASVKVAKSMLENDDLTLDPEIKKYLQWIVDNFSTQLDTDIGEIYNTATFDPKIADDLDEHVQHMINKGSIALTESDISWIVNTSNLYSEYISEGAKIVVNDDGETVPELCPKCGNKVKIFLQGEPIYKCSNKKCGQFFGVVPFKG